MNTNNIKHKPVRTSEKYRTSYSYRGFIIEKRSDDSWAYRDWSKTGTTIYGNTSSCAQYYFTRLKHAVSHIDSQMDNK